MMATKIMTFGFPETIGRDLLKAAQSEGQSVPEFVNETLRRRQAVQTIRALAAEGRKLAKKKGLTERDFGGPFAK
jgi:hypothetical protein